MRNLLFLVSSLKEERNDKPPEQGEFQWENGQTKSSGVRKRKPTGVRPTNGSPTGEAPVGGSRRAAAPRWKGFQ